MRTTSMERSILKITLLKLKMERNTETKNLRKPEVVTCGKFHSPVIISCKPYLPLDRSFLRNVKPKNLFCLLNHLSQTPFPNTFPKTLPSNSTKMGSFNTSVVPSTLPKSLLPFVTADQSVGGHDIYLNPYKNEELE